MRDLAQKRLILEPFQGSKKYFQCVKNEFQCFKNNFQDGKN